MATQPEPGSFLAGRLEGVLESLSACVSLARVAELMQLSAQDVREAIEALRDRVREQGVAALPEDSPVEGRAGDVAPSAPEPEPPKPPGPIAHPGETLTYCRVWVLCPRYEPGDPGVRLIRVYCHGEPKHEGDHLGAYRGRRLQWTREPDEHERVKADP
jgi:hypothetical protein